MIGVLGKFRKSIIKRPCPQGMGKRAMGIHVYFKKVSIAEGIAM
jgi:hypothetical protein